MSTEELFVSPNRFQGCVNYRLRFGGRHMSWRAWITFWILCVLWGVPYFFIKLALVELSPAFIAWSRLALAALVLLPIAVHRGVLLPALTALAFDALHGSSQVTGHPLLGLFLFAIHGLCAGSQARARIDQ